MITRKLPAYFTATLSFCAILVFISCLPNVFLSLKFSQLSDESYKIDLPSNSIHTFRAVSDNNYNFEELLYGVNYLDC